MQESSSQEAPHFSDFSAPQSPTPQGSISTDAIPQPEPMKERIRWPKMSVIKEWASLDEDLNRILEVTSAGTAERKVNTLTEITYNLAKERFGTIERKINIKAGKQPNRREREIYSAECKIFFSVLAKRMSTYIIENGYVNTSIQKGGIPRFAGCLEHTGVLCQMIHEARAKKGDLTVVWLDLANAYGSIPHNLIRTALKYYHIPDHIMVMISSYLDGIKLRFKMKNYITQWQHLERGIVTGCTVSPTLFIMGMNLIIKTGEKETRGPMMDSGNRQPAIRCYMDDHTVTTFYHVQARWVLTKLDKAAKWARIFIYFYFI